MNTFFTGEERRITALLLKYWESLKTEEGDSVPHIKSFDRDNFNQDIWKDNCFEIDVIYEDDNINEVKDYQLIFIGEKIKGLYVDGFFSHSEEDGIISTSVSSVTDICDSIVQNAEMLREDRELQYVNGTIKLRQCFLPFIDDRARIVKIIGALNYKIYSSKYDRYED